MMIFSWRTAAAGICLAAGAGAARAQTSSAIGQGAWIVSGSAGWSHNGGDGQAQTTDIFFSPSGLYFVRPRWAIGTSLASSYSKAAGVSAKSIGVGPEIRYYAADLTDRTMPFLRFAVRPLWTRNKVDNLPNAASSRQLEWDGGLGLTHLLATHVGLTGELFYTKVVAHYDDGGIVALDRDVDRNSYGLRIGITAFVF